MKTDKYNAIEIELRVKKRQILERDYLLIVRQNTIN